MRTAVVIFSQPLDFTAPSSSQMQLKPMPLPSGHEYQNAWGFKKWEDWMNWQ
jgi:hypothetical protein